MGYKTWTTYGYGVRVDDITTTPERLLKLAEQNEAVLYNVLDYLAFNFDVELYDEDDNELSVEAIDLTNVTIDDFDNLEGTYAEHGVTYVLYNIMLNNGLQIMFADDYDGIQYLLYTPTYPWLMKDHEKKSL